jgi:hypothetical protein
MWQASPFAPPTTLAPYQTQDQELTIPNCRTRWQTGTLGHNSYSRPLPRTWERP